MPRIYSLLIAAGHGERPDGTFDIGAYNGIDKTKEHDLNLRVQDYCIKALVKNPAFMVRADQNLLKAGHEPNWAGLKTYLRGKTVDLVVEIHHDAPNAKDAGFGITPYLKYIDSTPSKALAQRIGIAYSGLKLPIKPSYTDVRGLGLLKGLTMPVVIWECGVTRAVDDNTLKLRGEGIARGITAYFRIELRAMITMTDHWKIRKNMKPTAPLPTDNINKPKLDVLKPIDLYCPSCDAKIMSDGSCRCT